jgi:hypothetical protein
MLAPPNGFCVAGAPDGSLAAARDPLGPAAVTALVSPSAAWPSRPARVGPRRGDIVHVKPRVGAGHAFHAITGVRP